MTSRRMMLIGHRGASGSAPENTLAAFRRAVELGARWIEMDVCASRDGEIVVIHDDTLQRTTDGRGQVRDFTLAQLKRLDAGSWFHRRFAGERIPTLCDVAGLARRGGAGLFIEMKPGKHLDGALERKLVSLLARERMTGQSFVMSFDHAAVGRVKAIEPKLKTLLLIGKRTSLEKRMHALDQHRADGFSVASRLANPQLVTALHGRGKLLVVWTVNSLRQARRLTTMGVDGITTDRPERFIGRLKPEL